MEIEDIIVWKGDDGNYIIRFWCEFNETIDIVLEEEWMKELVEKAEHVWRNG